MSNKAIVFYTGELLEVQENSLREAYEVENIIFVPIETVDDLNTKILETTEQPFTVYNYLTDPDLIIAVCDKLSNLTAVTGFLPEYFIWVEEIKTSHRKEIKTEVFQSKPIDLNVSGGVAKQLIGRARHLPTTRVMQPESFMTAGVVLSDDVLYGMLFDDVPNCFIYTSSEKNLLSWFNAFIMNLAVSKREFPMLKAVIYAFEDERNQPMLGDDRDHQFVTRHIVTALELFGKTAGIEIFKPNEIEEFKKHIALTDEELEERKLLMAQTAKPEALHVDVSQLDVPDSVKDVMHRLKGKFEEQRPDPYLSYGEAIEMCKRGIDVACVNWKADEFLTFNTGVSVHANDFWSDGNKRAAMARSDKTLSVFPHFLRTTSYGTIPHLVDFNDQCSEWVVATDRIKVRSAKIVKEDLYDRLVLDFGLDTHSTADFELAPFWIVYDVLVKNPFSVTVISGTDQTNLPQIIGAIKSTYDQRQNITRHAWMLNESGYINEHPMPEAHIYHYVLHNVNSTVERILKGEFSCVIVDVDSFSSHLELSTVKHALKEAGTEWVAVSVKEQLQN